MNNKLKEEVESMQGSIIATAEKNPLPEGFMTVAKRGLNKATIINTFNGKEYDCPLYAYSEVREALINLL